MRILVLLFAAAALPAQAATLRPNAVLSAPVVRLADLFDGAGPRAAEILGPAPRPGERFVIEAGQLAAIARQFGVEWRPSSSADRAVVEQPGRPLPREALTEVLQTALAAAGAPPDSAVDLSGFDTPMIPLLARPHIAVEQLDYVRAGDGFAASVRVDGDGMTPLRFNLSGRVEAVIATLVPVRAIASGAVLRAGDLRVVRMRASTLHGDTLHDPAEAAGQSVRRPLPALQPILAADLTRPAAVSKGARVAMELHAPGLLIAAQGVALASAALGETVQVLNPVSHMIVEGEVTGPGRVTVATGNIPVPASTQVAAQ